MMLWLTLFISSLQCVSTLLCTSAFNCSYNGICKEGTCVCSPGWQGEYCHALHLGPAVNGSGLDQLHGPRTTSTWGGTVWRHDDGVYHMWSSEISHKCGIHRWTTNSIVVHAVSTGPPGWVFTRKEELFPIFTHEPIVARAPSGEYVIFVTQYPGPVADAPTCYCTNGNSASGGPGCAGEPGTGKNKTMYSYFTWASHPDGPWSPLVSLAGVQGHGMRRTDMNLAPVILPDGSAVAWTRWNIWTATHWKDPTTWKDEGQAPDFNNGAGWEGEDPSMWIDINGHYHIVSHNGARGKPGPDGDCGRHMFSTTGAAGTWNQAPFPKEYLGGCAYPRVDVPFTDGTNRTFYRRERPHLVFNGHTPVALTTAVIDSPTGPGVPGYTPPQRDASYTLLQPVIT